MLRQEHGNINGACEYALGPANDRQSALKIVGLLAVYSKASGSTAWARRLCERALDGAPPTRSGERALALMCLGISATFGLKSDADRPLIEAIDIAREVGDRWTVAYASGTLALWLAHAGLLEQARKRVEEVEHLAASLGDDVLRGLGGLARGWLLLAEGKDEECIRTLISAQSAGGDYHQHHLIAVYIGFAQYRRADYGHAAAQWFEGMRNAISVGHMRGIAGSIEGCAYIAVHLAKFDAACRFLAAAEQIRSRTQTPLFSFWVAHNEDARKSLRASMGDGPYEEALRAGARMREEDVTNEAATMLREIAARGTIRG